MKPLNKVITQQEIDNHNRPYLEKLMSSVTTRSTTLLEDMLKETITKPHHMVSTYSDREKFLILIMKNHGLPVTDAIKISEWESAKFTKIKSQYLEEGLIRNKQIKTGKPGKSFIVIELTEKGKKWLENKGYAVTHNIRGGTGHNFWTRKIGLILIKLGFNITFDSDGSDIIAKRNGNTLAVEIIMSKDNHQLNSVLNTIKCEYNRVIIACENRSIRLWIMKKLKSVKNINHKKLLFIEVRDFLEDELILISREKEKIIEGK